MFIENLNKMMNPQLGTTEKGALGYTTSGDAFVDFNFRIPQYRNNPSKAIPDFTKAMQEDFNLAIKMLFFLRDVRGGLGERNTFRTLLKHIALNAPETMIRIMSLVPHYGRWDDLFICVDTPVENEMISLLHQQIIDDISKATKQQPISLLAKWMPSINASSQHTRNLAKLFANKMNMSYKTYRKTLSTLREYLNIVERNLTARTYDKIDYSQVPSQAFLKYKRVFENNDFFRYQNYLNDLMNNKTKINTSTLSPYQIWHEYLKINELGRTYRRFNKLDPTLEEMWKNLPDTGEIKNTLVVADGSGSMLTCLGHTQIAALTIAQSLAVYFGERCTGEFKDTFITFSDKPQLVPFHSKTLLEKMKIISEYTEIANTDIEKVFALILNTALFYEMPQEELPETILIISDMEFDEAVWGRHDKALFDEIAAQFQRCGYILPKLVFWNVASRTGIVPMQVNEAGVLLVSGFNPNAIQIVMTGQFNPFLALKQVLDGERYKPVEMALQ
jgi:hypothetical protein